MVWSDNARYFNLFATFRQIPFPRKDVAFEELYEKHGKRERRQLRDRERE
jgi:hypothetical protein